MQLYHWPKRNDYKSINVSKKGKQLSFCKRDKDTLTEFENKTFTKHEFIKTMSKYQSFNSEVWSKFVFNWWESKGVIIPL